MKNSIRYFSLVTALVASVPFALAQVGGAINPTSANTANAAAAAQQSAARQQAAISAQATAAQGTASAQQSAQNASDAAISAANAGANISAQNAANSTMPSSPGTLNTSTGLTGSSSVSAVPSAGNLGVNADGTTTTGMSSAAQNSSVGAGFSNNAGMAVNPADTARNIRAANQSNRDAVLNQVEANRAATSQRVAELLGSTNSLSSESRQRFDAAYVQVQARETALRRSLQDTRTATGSGYAAAQSRLAADYEAYAQAVAEAQAAAGR